MLCLQPGVGVTSRPKGKDSSSCALVQMFAKCTTLGLFLAPLFMPVTLARKDSFRAKTVLFS